MDISQTPRNHFWISFLIYMSCSHVCSIVGSQTEVITVAGSQFCNFGAAIQRKLAEDGEVEHQCPDRAQQVREHASTEPPSTVVINLTSAAVCRYVAALLSLSCITVGSTEPRVIRAKLTIACYRRVYVCLSSEMSSCSGTSVEPRIG